MLNPKPHDTTQHNAMHALLPAQEQCPSFGTQNGIAAAAIADEEERWAISAVDATWTAVMNSRGHNLACTCCCSSTTPLYKHNTACCAASRHNPQHPVSTYYCCHCCCYSSCQPVLLPAWPAPVASASAPTPCRSTTLLTPSRTITACCAVSLPQPQPQHPLPASHCCR